jgi:IS5 family transposase
MEKRPKNTALTATTLAPAGTDSRKDAVMPVKKHTTETAAEQRTTALKLLHIRMDVRAGKIMRDEMSSVPIMRMPTTIVTAVRSAISVL